MSRPAAAVRTGGGVEKMKIGVVGGRQGVEERKGRMVDREQLRRDGFSEAEIDKIDFYCEAQAQAGKLDRTATPLVTGGEIKLVCATAAEAVRTVWKQRGCGGSGERTGRAGAALTQDGLTDDDPFMKELKEFEIRFEQGRPKRENAEQPDPWTPAPAELATQPGDDEQDQLEGGVAHPGGGEQADGAAPSTDQEQNEAADGQTG
jgi:hypothetical protein